MDTEGPKLAKIEALKVQLAKVHIYILQHYYMLLTRTYLYNLYITLIHPVFANFHVNQIKSDYLRHPLNEEMENEEIFLGADAIQVIKYHGSYQQDNREQRKAGEQKKYSFMLRLKSPAGEVTPELFRLVDDLSNNYGQQDLRCTTRQCFQIHGILKGNLKTVISSLMNIGSSTVGVSARTRFNELIEGERETVFLNKTR